MRLTTTGNIAFLLTFFPTSLFLSPFSLSLCLSFFMSLANQRQVERERERGRQKKQGRVFALANFRIFGLKSCRGEGGRNDFGSTLATPVPAKPDNYERSEENIFQRCFFLCVLSLFPAFLVSSFGKNSRVRDLSALSSHFFLTLQYILFSHFSHSHT